MRCQLLYTHGQVQLYFKDWTSLREANEASYRMREFDREFHQAIGEPKSPNQALQPTADRRENLLSMTKTLKPVAKLALVSGG